MRNQEIELHASLYPIIHLPQASKQILITPLVLFHIPLQSTPKGPTENPFKIHKNLENKGALKEFPCMHEGKLPKGLENPWLQGGSNGLPLEVSNKKRSLEKRMNLAEIL